MWGNSVYKVSSNLLEVKYYSLYHVVKRLHVKLFLTIIDTESHGNPTSSLDTLLALLETEAAKTEESSEVTTLQKL